jgi:molybdopterin biosynthesis enzyme
MGNALEAWILTVGNEIINGVITDTNRESISRELRAVGISVKGMSSVGDDVDLIADALDHAMQRADVTIVSGGLGPTEDDKTVSWGTFGVRPGAIGTDRGAIPSVGSSNDSQQCEAGPFP